MPRILYFVDKPGISAGYRPIFNQILTVAGINPRDITPVSVYGAGIKNAVHKFRNDSNWTANPEAAPAVATFVDAKIKLYKPKMIVTSCPAITGLLTNYDINCRHVDTVRGSVYEYKGIKAVVATPIGALHRLLKHIPSFDPYEETVEGENSYYIKAGEYILLADWQKIGRIANNKTVPLPEFRWQLVTNPAQLAAAEKFLLECAAISMDIETRRGGITCIGYYGLRHDGKSMGFVFPLYDAGRPDNSACLPELEEAIWRTANRIATCPAVKIFQNGGYDNAYFIRDRIPVTNWFLDTIHLWHSFYPELDKSLDFISSILLDNYQYWKQDIKGVSKASEASITAEDMMTYWRYNAQDCYYTLMCAMRLLKHLLSGGAYAQKWYASELTRAHWALIMSMRGVRVDMAEFNRMREEQEKLADELQERFKIIAADPNFNIRSPKDKDVLFYELLGAPPHDSKGKLIKAKGKRSTGKDALRMIGEYHPLFQRVTDELLAALAPASQVSKVFGLQTYKGRLRTAYNAAATTTNRLGSRESPFYDGGNLQNIRKSMRGFIQADPGWLFIEVDYSQSDAAFVAFESNDPNYIETMTSGKDTHCIHCSHFFKLPYDDLIAGRKEHAAWIEDPVTGVRSITKRIVHGANFVMSGRTLYVQMGRKALVTSAERLGYPNPHKMTRQELETVAQRLLNSFRELYPRLSITGWYGELLETLRQNKGLLTNAFGMTRRFMGNPNEHATLREAAGFMGQSDTAGNINRTFDELFFGLIPKTFRDGPNPHANERPLKIDGNDFFLMLQTHDSLTAQIKVDSPEFKQNVHNLLTVMRRPIIINGHEVSIPVDAQIGPRWGKSMVDIDLRDLHALDRVVATSS